MNLLQLEYKLIVKFKGENLRMKKLLIVIYIAKILWVEDKVCPITRKIYTIFSGDKVTIFFANI